MKDDEAMIRVLENALELKQNKMYFEGHLFTGIGYFSSDSEQWTAREFNQGHELKYVEYNLYPLSLVNNITSVDDLKGSGIGLDIDEGILVEEIYMQDDQQVGCLSLFDTGQPELLEQESDDFNLDIEWNPEGQLIQCYVFSRHLDYNLRVSWSDTGKLKALSFDGDWKRFAEDEENPFRSKFNNIKIKADERLFLSGDGLTDGLLEMWLINIKGVKQFDLYDTQLSVPFIQAWIKDNPPESIYIKDDRELFSEAFLRLEEQLDFKITIGN